MRQLAAILFADMVGYTALMQENEHLAMQKRRRLKNVLEEAVNRFHGKILQYYGDGSLSIFNSAINGVTCALEIQSNLRQEPTVDVRMGIHTGDVTIEEDSVYGDGVNLASRIESLAVPGGIFISEKVWDEIKNQEHIKTQEVGYFELKNVKQPVRLFAVANPGIVVPKRHELEGKTKPPVNRLAVLPFMNMSPDPENEYFSDGITEELLNALTKVEGLQVTSRTSAFAFKGKHDDVREIGIRLNVDKILEGSVRKAGNRVRVTAQLINAADGYHLWSETYDRNLTDIFEVQDEISHIISNRLRENLVPAKNEPLVKAPTQNLEAYTLYLKGLHFRNKLTPADTRKAIDYFEQALALEPNYAQAYAMAANAYAFYGGRGQMNPEQAFAKVKFYSDKASELDPTIAESYIARGYRYLFYKCEWDAAYKALQTAINLNPAAAEAFQILGYYYVIIGKKEEAEKTLRHALLIDPLSPIINHSFLEMLVVSGKWDEGIRQADKLLEMDPQMRVAIELKGMCIGLKGDWHKALELFKEFHRLTNHPLKGVTPMGYAYAKLGEREEALECIQKIEQRRNEDANAILESDLLMIWWALGDKEKVAYYASQLIQKKVVPVLFYLENTILKGIANEPWFVELKQRVGL